MICPRRFVDMLGARGFSLATGVPCSYLTELINTVIGHPGIEYVGSANEGDAVAIACGAELGGKLAAVLLQNSGLGNAVSPLTSLAPTFRIPVLLLATWRGEPNGSPDEPQHEVMGRITPGLFDLMGIRWKVLPPEEDQVPEALDVAVDHMRTTRAPFALIVRKGTFAKSQFDPGRGGPSPYSVAESAPSVAGRPEISEEIAVFDQDDVLRTVQASVRPGDAVLATTGYTGRALYALEDRISQFYMVGSMGCLSSLGLGLAKTQPRRKVVVLDGDGAFLMRMGALAVLGHQTCANLVHVLLDNGVHDSTGGQATVAPSIDAAGIAEASGYPRAMRVGRLSTLADVLREPVGELTFLHVKTQPRSNRKLPRPHVTPAEVAARFRQWLRET